VTSTPIPFFCERSLSNENAGERGLVGSESRGEELMIKALKTATLDLCHEL
jgi:hypothetical protein